MASRTSSDVGEIQDECSRDGRSIGSLSRYRGVESKAKQVCRHRVQVGNRKEKVGTHTFVAATTPSRLRTDWRGPVMGVVMGVVGVVMDLGLRLGLRLGLGLGVVGPPQAAGHRATEDVPVAKTGGLEEHAACWQMRREQSSLSPSYRVIACRPRGRPKPSARHVVILVPTVRLVKCRGCESAELDLDLNLDLDSGRRRLARHVGGYKRYVLSQLRNMPSG